MKDHKAHRYRVIKKIIKHIGTGWSKRS